MTFNQYKINENTAILYLRDQKHNIVGEALIDTEDLQKLIDLDLSWYRSLSSASKEYYVYATKYLGLINGKPKYKKLQLHRILMGQDDPNIFIDHMDANPYNNRKENLRLSDKPLNSKNRKSKNKNNTTGYRNVCFYKGFYIVQLQINGKNTKLGSFRTPEEAGDFAQMKRHEIYGEYAGN